MSEETLKIVQEQWGYCSDFLKKALINRYHEIQPGLNNSDWFNFLAEEFGLDEG